MRIRKVILILISLLCYCLVSPNIYAKIRVGIPFYKPPFVIDQNEGFDINIMNMVCSRLQEECDYHSMEFHKLYASLDKNEIDVAIGGLTISMARKTQYIFSIPYLPSNGRFLVLLTNPVNSIDELNQKKIGIIRDSVYEDFLFEHYGSKFQGIVFEGPTVMIEALSNKQIDGVFSDEITIKFWSAQTPGLFKRLSENIPISSGFAIMSVSKNRALIESINKILLQMENEGTYTQLYDTYFLH